MHREYIIEVIETCIRNGVTVPLHILVQASELGLIIKEIETTDLTEEAI